MPLPLGVWFVIYVPISALTLTIGWQEGYLDHKKPNSTNSKRFSSWSDGGG